MGRKKVLSLEQVEEAKKLRGEGYTLSMLAKKYGVSVGAVSNATRQPKEGEETQKEKPAEPTTVKPTGGIAVKAEIISEEQQPSAVKAAKQGAEKAKLEGETKAEAAVVWERWQSTIEIMHLWGINSFVLNKPELGDRPLDVKNDGDRLALENIGQAWTATLQYYFPQLPEGSPVLLLGLAYGGLGMQVMKRRGHRPSKAEKVAKSTEELKEVMEEPELSEEDIKVIEEVKSEKKRPPLTDEEMSRLAAKF
jgi:hypothetical protein